MFGIKDTAIFVVQAILVISAVVVFSYFDPFDIFNFKKLRMTDTSLIINSTKDIGELITAEFYGEVLVGSRESFEVNYQSQKDSLTQSISSIHKDFNLALNSIDPKFLQNWNNLYKEFRDDNIRIFEAENFDIYWNILKTYSDADQDNIILKRLYQNRELWAARKEDEIIKEYLQDVYNIEKEGDKRSRQKLIILGRGWVKAGIEFDNFDENNFRYYKGQKKIYLINRSPKIISATINPWLSPENKIKGWEIVEVNGKAEKEGIKLITEVKQTALDKLILQAEEAGILEKAMFYAKENLSAFFSLILEEEVTVEFVGHILDSYLDEIAADSTFSPFELQAAVAHINRHVEDFKHSYKFYNNIIQLNQDDSLKKSKNLELPWHYRTIYHQVLNDQKIDELDSIKIGSVVQNDSSISSVDLFYYLMQIKQSSGEQYNDVFELLEAPRIFESVHQVLINQDSSFISNGNQKLFNSLKENQTVFNREHILSRKNQWNSILSRNKFL
jgi:hypothetical protein